MGEMQKNVGPAQTPTGGQQEPRKHGSTAGTVPKPAFKNVGNNRGPCGQWGNKGRRRDYG